MCCFCFFFFHFSCVSFAACAPCRRLGFRPDLSYLQDRPHRRRSQLLAYPQRFRVRAIVRRRYVIHYALQTRVVIKQIPLCRLTSRALCLYVRYSVYGEWCKHQRSVGRGAQTMAGHLKILGVCWMTEGCGQWLGATKHLRHSGAAHCFKLPGRLCETLCNRCTS